MPEPPPDVSKDSRADYLLAEELALDVHIKEVERALKLDLEDGIICESWLGGLLRHYRRAA